MGICHSKTKTVDETAITVVEQKATKENKVVAKPVEEKKEKEQSSTYSSSFFSYSGPSLSDRREEVARRIYRSTHHENFSRREWHDAYRQAVKQVKW